MATCGGLWEPLAAKSCDFLDPGTRGFDGLWQPVAGCGSEVLRFPESRGKGVWRPVAACGGLWQRSLAPYITLHEESKNPRQSKNGILEASI